MLGGLLFPEMPEVEVVMKHQLLWVFLAPPWFLVLVPLVIIGPWQVIGDIGTLLFSFVVPFLGCWEEWEGATSFLA